MKKISAGFTLLELMVVVGIVSILFAIAVPLFNDHKAKARDMSAHADAKNIVSVLVAAKK